MRELNVRWIGEKTKEMKRERVREIEERARLVKEDRKRRDKNVVWRGVEGDDRGERRKFINEILWKVLGREVKLGRIEERVGGSGEMLLVEMEEMLDRKEVLRRGKEIRRRWGVRVDEDLTIEERMRWRMVEAARQERAKGRRAVVTNRKLWVNGRRWR